MGWYFLLFFLGNHEIIFIYFLLPFRYITEEVEKIDGIFIVGKPEVSVVAIGMVG